MPRPIPVPRPIAGSPGRSSPAAMSPEADSAETTTPLGMTSSGAAGTEAGATARVPGFSVSLPQFEGPFDLLLALIARRRLDVTELALAEVTDEFIAHMRADWDLGRASEFLVVASTLLALKAQRLLPHDPDDEDEDLELLEARDLLFARLLQYRATSRLRNGYPIWPPRPRAATPVLLVCPLSSARCCPSSWRPSTPPISLSWQYGRSPDRQIPVSKLFTFMSGCLWASS